MNKEDRIKLGEEALFLLEIIRSQVMPGECDSAEALVKTYFSMKKERDDLRAELCKRNK